MQEGLIFDIRRFAIHDGPGIRMVVFFKGCNLRCAWCHNPESISPAAEKMYTAQKCIGCAACVEACPQNAIVLSPEGIKTSTQCTVCGICAEVCPSLATEISGKPMDADAVMQLIRKERVFFDTSGGGVTFSGGEPLLHTRQLMPLLQACRNEGIHTAIDTAGNIPSKSLREAAKLTDLFLYDLKMMDDHQHRQWTGQSNRLILKNLQELAGYHPAIVVRIPLMGGINDTPENLQQTAHFVAGLKGERKEVQLLPYHAIAQNKYRKMGQESRFERMNEPNSSSLELAVEIFHKHGLKASIGG
jgi:pyruvate formate lyase activating enzyme